MPLKAKLISPATKLDSLIDENDQLISIFVRSLKTAKERNRKIK